MRASTLIALSSSLLLLACGGPPGETATSSASLGAGDLSHGVILKRPTDGVAIGHFDEAAQTYVFMDGVRVAIRDIDTRHDIGVDPMGFSPADRGPRPALPGAIGRDGLVELRRDVMRCWNATYGSDGGAIFCTGCCTDDTCRENCMDLRLTAEVAALRQWTNLDPIPPERPLRGW